MTQETKRLIEELEDRIHARLRALETGESGAEYDFAGANAVQLVRIADSLEAIARGFAIVEQLGRGMTSQPGAISPMALLGALMK